jgi:long-chain acyl-CoA synthetase
LENIQQHKVTCFHIVPAMYNAILTLKQIEKFDLSSLRWVVVFGAPSSPEIMQRFNKYCPNAKLLNGWGMTETCPPNTVTPFDSDNIASVGKPAPSCSIKIVDEQGQELPNGTIGEIVISGWVIMDCYYKDPEATASVKRDGGLHTGDLGRIDDEGFLYIVGRKKEMIKVAGQIVYAPEVEAAFYKNEIVAEVAVIGIPDSLRGETVKAFVVLVDGNKSTSEDLRYFAKEHLAHFKVPQSIEIRSELPKNRAGKIDKILLKTLEPTSVSHQSLKAES